MSTVSRTCLIYANKGNLPPDDYLARAAAKYNSWYGFAFVQNGEIMYDMAAEGATSDGIKLFLQNKDVEGIDKIVVLGKEANSVTLDPEKDADHTNIQPLILIETGESNNAVPQCLAFIDGKFDELESNTSPEGRPYLWCGQFLMPLIQEKWEDSGEDVVKFFDRIKRPTFYNSIEKQDPELSVLLLCSNNTGHIYIAAKDSHDFSWGYTNDICGWEEKKADPPSGRKGRMSLTGGVSAAAVETAIGAKTDETTNTSSVVLYEGRMPANIIKANDMKALYKKYHGRDEPPGWKNGRPWVSILPNMVDNARQQGWNIRTSKHLAAQTPVSPGTTETPPQILTDVMKDKLLKFVSAIDANTQQVISPEEMEKNETASPTFWDDTGITLETGIKVFGGKEEHRTTLIKENPTAASKLIRDLCYALFRQEAAIEAFTEPPAKPSIEPPTIVTQQRKFSLR